jgi:hypothetical protein
MSRIPSSQFFAGLSASGRVLRRFRRMTSTNLPRSGSSSAETENEPDVVERLVLEADAVGAHA